MGMSHYSEDSAFYHMMIERIKNEGHIIILPNDTNVTCTWFGAVGQPDPDPVDVANFLITAISGFAEEYFEDEELEDINGRCQELFDIFQAKIG